MYDAIVIGAGVAGLQCARRLADAGAQVVVLDRASRVGGRCATREIDHIPFEYGPLFLHGDEPAFLGALDAVADVHRLEGWPCRVEGRGTPCQPEAFAPHQRRLAFVEGLHQFPRALASGLPIRLNTQVAAIAADADGVTATSADGQQFCGRDLVLALALEQTLGFLPMLPPGAGLAGATAMLGLFASVPCLTVAAIYSRGSDAPAWDVCFPEEGDALLAISNESSKRPEGGRCLLVLQGQPRWSRERLEQPSETWSAELLGHGARLLGRWAASPEQVHPHRWRYARLDKANELANPLVFRVGASRVGVAGDLFAAGGGVQAAWMSGDRLGAMLCADARPRSHAGG